MGGGAAACRGVPSAAAAGQKYRGFLNLLSNEWRWAQAREEYARIGAPVLLVYGERDWAPAAARERDSSTIPRVATATVEAGGHFLSLDRPGELAGLIVQFAPARAAGRPR